MDLVATLVSRYFNVVDGNLFVGEVPVSFLASHYGTPLFVYDERVLNYKWTLLRQTLPPEFSISYSVKANPNKAILQYFLAKGCGLEIASGGEFSLALRAGCPPQKILFAGPGKTEAELELVLVHGIGEIHVESLREIERVRAISQRLGIPARVALRVNPSGEAQGGAMRMGGKPAPFGVDEESIDPILDRLASDPWLEFRGIHLFAGTQILDYAVLLHQYRKGIEIARRVINRLRQSLSTLDFGGGLGIPYFPNESELDMERLHEGLAELMTEIAIDGVFTGTQFVVEPGRYLVGDSGLYMVRIIDIKVSRGKKFLIVDGGMNHHLAASGNLGQVIKRNFPVVLVDKLAETHREAVDVVGPLCTPLDTLARDVLLPSADVGDLLGILQSGAYARSASPLGFLSHPTPAEVLVRGGESYIIRRRGTYDDWCNDLL
jgi:diaminopimelate decarboxylase